MKLSFDLDGVVADTDNGLLALLHRADRDDLPGARDDLLQYYARRRVLLNPREFAGEGDYIYIITGRVPVAHPVTTRWVERNIGLPRSNLILVGDIEVEDLYREGHDSRAAALLGERKRGVIQDLGAAVHFDNNPGIIDTLRRAGLIAIQVGPGIM